MDSFFCVLWLYWRVIMSLIMTHYLFCSSSSEHSGNNKRKTQEEKGTRNYGFFDLSETTVTSRCSTHAQAAISVSRVEMRA